MTEDTTPTPDSRPAVVAPFERQVRPRIERLKWWDAQRHPPDHDCSVLVLLRDARPFSQPRWTTGYWDKRAGLWRDENMRAFSIDTVALYWAEPDGPPGPNVGANLTAEAGKDR